MSIAQPELESYLWGAATVLRGTIDAGDYKQFIFPLLFFKRISDVWDEECQQALDESSGDIDYASFAENHRFQLPDGAHWQDVRAVATNVGRALQHAMRVIEQANPDRLHGIFGDAQWTNKDRLSDETLRDLVEHFSTKTLSTANIPEDQFGQAYEYLIKRFADDSGHTAQEFYTNRTLVHLMTLILDPQPGESVYDPTCGTGGMLLSAAAELRRQGKEYRNLKLYGQELNLMSSSIARMNLFLHGILDFTIERGNTLSEPRFLEGDRLRQFDVVLANPPYSIKQWDRKLWASDPYDRNRFGTPPQGRADYAFFQHILASMKPGSGRCAILFPHGVLFREDEREMRRHIIEADLIDCVLGLGPGLFYNSPMEACVVFCRTDKPVERRGKVMFINAGSEFVREETQSYLSTSNQQCILSAYRGNNAAPHIWSLVSNEDLLATAGNLNVALYAHSSNGATSGYQLKPLKDALAGWLMNRHQVEGSNAAETTPHRILTFEGRGISGQHIVRFGEVVHQMRANVGNNLDDLDHYVAGEHMDTDELQLTRWGTIGDGYLGPAFHRRFNGGQVLYGSRRTYLRKVAIAPFDGVCANTTFVCESADERVLLPDLVPYVMSTEAFHAHSIAQSKGSVNPYVNWKDIASFEFVLPSVEEQQRLIELLRAADDAAARVRRAAEAALCISLSVASDGASQHGVETELGACMQDIQAGKSLPGSSLPPDDANPGVLKVSAVGDGEFLPTESKALLDAKAFIADAAVHAGDLLITRANTSDLVGRVCKVPDDFPNLMLSDKTLRLVLDEKKVRPDFAELALRLPQVRTQLRVMATGTGGAMKNISQAKLRKLTFAVPTLDVQDHIVAVAHASHERATQLRRQRERLLEMKRALLNERLGPAG